MDRLPANSYALIDEISNEFICPVTKELLVDPYQSSCCGHFFSKEAFDKLLTQKAKCPMCRSISWRCTPDKAFKRRVHQLKVKCLLHNGCNWTGSFSDFLQHCGISINDASSTKSMSPIVTKNVKDFSMENFSTYLDDRTYFQSPTFFTHAKGYKMCIRVYPYGYDACEGTHVCVVTYLMNGQNDDKLQFPFRGSVTVQVLNHNDEDENYERIFDFSDKTDDIICMRVPESEVMNSGLAMYNFIPLNELKNTKGAAQYLKEDILTFKVAKIVVKSISSEQLQHEDIKSSIVQESKEEAEWNSKTLPVQLNNKLQEVKCDRGRVFIPLNKESGTNVTAERTTSNEQSLKPQPSADDNEISRSRSKLNKQLSKESNSSVESSGSGKRNRSLKRSKAVQRSEDDVGTGMGRKGSLQRTKSLQHSADDGAVMNNNERRESTRSNSELHVAVEDDGPVLRVISRGLSGSSTCSSQAYVEDDGTSSIYEPNDSDNDNIDAFEPDGDHATAGSMQKTAQSEFGRNRGYSDGAIVLLPSSRSGKELKKHKSSDDAVLHSQTSSNQMEEISEECSDRTLMDTSKKQSMEGSRFFVYMLLGAMGMIIVAILMSAFLQKSLTPFLDHSDLDPKARPAQPAVHPVYITVTPASMSYSSDTTNSTCQAMELKMKNLANEVAAKVTAKWRIIGVQLEIPANVLDDIQSQVAGRPDSNMHAFELMLEKWRILRTSPYEWRTIITALESPAVGEQAVADELKNKFKGIT